MGGGGGGGGKRSWYSIGCHCLHLKHSIVYYVWAQISS